MNTNFKINKAIGILLMTGAVLLFIPYTVLTITFEYPDILRQDTGVILSKFHEGGAGLIGTWWAFAIVGLPLLAGYVLIGQKLEHQFAFVRFTITIGVIGLIVQMIGLLRWTFVVPVLANNYVQGDETAKAISIQIFQAIHQYGGVALGEHLGQLFTVFWTVGMTYTFSKTEMFSRWTIVLGYMASFIYFLAQTELFATVIPAFPVVDFAGFAGSTLWLIWLIVIGVRFFKTDEDEAGHPVNSGDLIH